MACCVSLIVALRFGISLCAALVFASAGFWSENETGYQFPPIVVVALTSTPSEGRITSSRCSSRWRITVYSIWKDAVGCR